MRRRNFILPAAALVGLVLFFCFLIRLLLLRYERGDVYPEYSTFRADPLGTRAYYEALDSMPQYPVARGFVSLRREIREKPGTMFYLGFDARELDTFTKEDIAELDDFVKTGGRVVMTFAPQDPHTPDDDTWDKSEDKKKKTEAAKKDAVKPDPTPPAKADETPSPEEKNTGPQTEQEKYERDEFRRDQEEEAKENPGKHVNGSLEKYERSLGALWGFGWDVDEAPKQKQDNSYAAASKPVPEKPEVFAQHLYEGNVEAAVPWKSAIFLVRLEPEWQRIYDAKSKPVLVRRKWGKGEIILATDSYFISNEALRNNRRPFLLNFVTGVPGPILFDETHLGTQEQEGVMFLAEKFRLEGYLYGMLGVVLLFLWRNSIPLVPPRYASQHALLGGAVSGKDSRSGLVNLLRRNIAAADILNTSFNEWRRHATPGRGHLQEKADAMQAVLSATEGTRADTIVQSYHQLREINTPSRAKGNYATKS